LLRWSGKGRRSSFFRGGGPPMLFWRYLFSGLPSGADSLRWSGKSVDRPLPGRRAARGGLAIFVILSTLRGPILSVRAERIGRKARQRKGLFIKPPFPLKSHPPKPGRPRWSYGSRARARPLAVPRRAVGLKYRLAVAQFEFFEKIVGFCDDGEQENIFLRFQIGMLKN